MSMSKWNYSRTLARIASSRAPWVRKLWLWENHPYVGPPLRVSLCEILHFKHPSIWAVNCMAPRTFTPSVLKAMQVVDLFKLWSCRDVQFKMSTCWIVKLATWGVDRVVELSVLTQNNQSWKGTQEGRLPRYCSFPILQVSNHPSCEWSKFKEWTRQHMKKEQAFRGK